MLRLKQYLGAVLIRLYSLNGFKQKKVVSINGDANVLVVPCLRPFGTRCRLSLLLLNNGKSVRDRQGRTHRRWRVA